MYYLYIHLFIVNDSFDIIKINYKNNEIKLKKQQLHSFTNAPQILIIFMYYTHNIGG